MKTLLSILIALILLCSFSTKSMWYASYQDTTNTAVYFANANTNFTITIGTCGTNFTLTIGGYSTNFASQIGANGTNYSVLIGTYSTNFANSIGANATNYANLITNGAWTGSVTNIFTNATVKWTNYMFITNGIIRNVTKS